MQQIYARVRPKLVRLGDELTPALARRLHMEFFPHVARHARRTVNPPDDTWAALGPNARGYKKDVHFKVAVSRNCVRFLFEVGPEYYAKRDWADGWHREFKDIAGLLKGNKDLDWFKGEHDEEPAAHVLDFATADLKKLGDDLTRRKDAQLVFGRRVAAAEFVSLKPKQVEKAALDTFKPLAALFQIHEARVLA